MTAATEPRLPVLAHPQLWQLDVRHAKSDEIKAATRFWFSVTLSNAMPRPEGERVLADVFQDSVRIATAVRSMSVEERQLLSVYRRYGGTMSKSVLRLETAVRGLDPGVSVDKSHQRPPFHRTPDSKHPFFTLQRRMVLRPAPSAPSMDFESWQYHFDGFFAAVAHPDALAVVPTAGPAGFRFEARTNAPGATHQRSPVDVMLEVTNIANELERMGRWKTGRGGGILKPLANKLRKTVTASSSVAVPDSPGLIYEMLRQLGVIPIDTQEGRIDRGRLDALMSGSAEDLLCQLTRSWMRTELWQDGIGLVPDRESRSGTNRIVPSGLFALREFLAWGLCELAHDPPGWVDLESWLRALYQIQAEQTPNVYAHDLVWKPKFQQSERKRSLPPDQGRMLAYWLDTTGTVAANAILGTLTHLGLVESSSPNATGPYTFRLTELGRVVLGRPESRSQSAASGDRFLSVLSNFEVHAYSDAAPLNAIGVLGRFARPTGAMGGPVHTFAIERESVYRALESGFSIENLRTYLTTNSRTPVPTNVLRTLEEWSAKRDGLVLRRGVTLLIGATKPPPTATAIGDGFHILLTEVPKRGTGAPPAAAKADRPFWRADETGRVYVDTSCDAFARARLLQFAERNSRGGYQITAGSIAHAKRLGFSAEATLTRLRQHHHDEIPPLLEVMIRNWHGRAMASLETLCVVTVPDAVAAHAIHQSARFQPYLVRFLPPTSFVIERESRTAVKELLAQIGYTIES